ncbi:MFS transporter [Herbaspirillum sp. LeCh32-8]|uniref:MFS transporter n=1 Tax=Herbaspirillum sp. LeCh32-8 TaxID=2821356 RepID=UPI001AE3E86E|nr:MFS transporter [Herbaspirillum sp. LeCh32-8]MBP0599537.1 MFS transporter [Herbaspirillum sp. LeCh32-8]
MNRRRLVLCLGAGQMISWGITYYLVGALGLAMAAGLGWSSTRIQGGFALALLAMGLCSPRLGEISDRHGGRAVMCAGSLFNAAGCAMLAMAHGSLAYYAGWLLLGLGMRCTLYDAAFAALARIGGGDVAGTGRAMAQITLPGGLSATLFWPLGQALCEAAGWRAALWVYALLALCTLPLHCSLPSGRNSKGALASSPPPQDTPPLAREPRQILLSGILFAALTTLANFLNAGMSAHMISILGGMGVAGALAVWIAALRGVGQSAARLMDILFARGINPLSLNLLACLLLPLAFAIGLAAAGSAVATIAFALLYGAGNGLLSITRGTLPLSLFDHRSYGGFVGRLVAPGFVLSAAAPVLYAWLMQALGARAGMWLSGVCALAILAAAAALRMMFPRRSPGAHVAGISAK